MDFPARVNYRFEPAEDGSDDDRSLPSSTGNDNGGDLFVDSTISRDDTSSEDPKQRSLFSHLNNPSSKGGECTTAIPTNFANHFVALQLNSFTPSSTTLARAQSYPLPNTMNPEPFQGSSLPIVRMYPPLSAAPPRPPQIPPFQEARLPHGIYEYPTTKVSKNAEWRYKLIKDRSILSDFDNDDSEQHNSPQSQKAPGAEKGEIPNEDTLDAGIPSLVYGKASTANVFSAPLESQLTRNENDLELGKYQNTEDGGNTFGKQVKFPSSPPPQRRNIYPHITMKHKLPPEDDGTDKKNPGRPSLAESLSSVSEKYLGVDVLDQTQDVSRFISYLLDTIQMLENRVRYSRAKDDYSWHGGSPDTSSDNKDDTKTDIDKRPNIPRGQIIHRVYCFSSLHAHDRTIYEDEPVFRGNSLDGKGSLMGKVEIGNINTYLGRHPDIAFLVIREHSCAESGTALQYWAQSNRGSERSQLSTRGERIRIMSPLLQKALAQVAEFHIYSQVQHYDSQSSVGIGIPHEMEAPYPFLFHHRHKLTELAQQTTYNESITPLLEFLNENYNSEYEEVENLLRKGCISAYHVSKLFKPNQIVISRQSPDVLDAYVLSSYPILEKDSIKFRGWSWQYNGRELARQQWEETIDTVAEEPSRISDLSVHPIEFARSEDIQKLEARGKKFWDMKGQVYTCYTGWDKGHERYYVSLYFIPSAFGTLMSY